MFKSAPILILISFSIAINSYGQINNNVEKVVLNKEIMGGITLHTHGWGINLNTSVNKKVFKKRLYSFELIGMKHVKETKSYNPVINRSKGYVYGKLNTLTILRSSIGYKKIIAEKIRTSGVRVAMVNSFGASLGFTKPVYLEISRTNDFDNISIEKYNPNIHNTSNILGRGPTLKGLDDLKFIPGAFAKVGFAFEYANENDKIKAIEVGASIDAFSKRVPILAIDKNQQFYFSFYLNWMFGKKYE